LPEGLICLFPRLCPFLILKEKGAGVHQMLKIENLSKAYGSQALFKGVTVNVHKGERVGLVGRNGHGKTTLLRLITGEEVPDEGRVKIPKGYRIGYLRQELNFTRSTVLEEAAADLPEDQLWRAEKVLAGLGFSQSDMERPPSDFSGGYQVRLNLARLLVSDADLLLLDEPTNYLDVVAIRWLEKFFFSWKGELLLVTHDRSFMDSVTTHTMGIHRQRIRKMAGTTGKYYSQIAQEEEVHERSRVNIERKRRQTEDFIRKFRAKARLVGLVQSRIRTLEKQKVPQRLEAIKALDFSFRPAPFEAKMLLETEDLGFAWSPQTPALFSGLRLRVGRGDRVAVVGSNGKGKTTLLRVINGELERSFGEVKIHERTRIGFFGQTNVGRLQTTRTVVEELLAADPDRSVEKARAVAGKMMFEGDTALKKIGVLSGGEKSRVLLGRMLLEPHNLLLLDEPTNHLDMDTSEALLEALEEFEGAVIIVTHNEMFLHRLAQRLVVFDGGGLSVFEGTYDRFLEEVGWLAEKGPDGAGVETARKGRNPSPGTGKEPRTGIQPLQAHGGAKDSKKGNRKEKARLLARRSTELAPLKEEIGRLEGSIREAETRIEEVNRELVEASTGGDAFRIGGLSRELKDLKKTVENSYRDLFMATENLEDLEEKWKKEMEPGI
jgi:ATP-binding cassette subfamily F protein 3